MNSGDLLSFVRLARCAGDERWCTYKERVMLELRTGKFQSRQFSVEVSKVGGEFDIRGFMVLDYKALIWQGVAEDCKNKKNTSKLWTLNLDLPYPP